MNGRHVVGMLAWLGPEHPIGGIVTLSSPNNLPKSGPRGVPKGARFFPVLQIQGRGIIGHPLGHLGWHMPANPLRRLLGQPRTRQANPHPPNKIRNTFLRPPVQHSTPSHHGYVNKLITIHSGQCGMECLSTLACLHMAD